MSTEHLAPLTLDAIKAASIAHHLQRGTPYSHFNPEVTDAQRLAELGDLLGKIFEHAALYPDAVKLQQNLLWMSATAAIWAEMMDRPLVKFKEGGLIE